MRETAWKRPSEFYWRKEFVYNGVPVWAEIIMKLAKNEVEAENLFLRFRETKFPEIHRGFKESCSYELEIGERRLKITCFRTHTQDGMVIGIRLSS